MSRFERQVYKKYTPEKNTGVKFYPDNEKID